MDKCTTEVRRQYWKGIIAQCQARPEGQSAKAWLEENHICEQTYYLWQRRIRQETFEKMNEVQRNVPAVSQGNEISFAEFPLHVSGYNSGLSSAVDTVNPVAVIKTEKLTITLLPNISDHLLSTIIQEVAHAWRCSGYPKSCTCMWNC